MYMLVSYSPSLAGLIGIVVTVRLFQVLIA
jgi:hypothetical protein